MNVLELIRNGGFLAMGAAAVGVIGVLVGVIGFAVKGKSAVGIGVFTLLLGTGAAGLGMIGTVYGKHRTDEAIAMVNPVDRDLIRQAGYEESQGAALVGFGASLLPLLFGFAHVMRARGSASAPVVASLTAPAREESAAPVAMAALAFGVMGLLAAAGAFVMGRQPLPKGAYDLARDDQDGWDLARAVGEMKENPDNACLRLDAALLKYCTPATAWPRVFAKEPPRTIDWRPAATECVERYVHPVPGERAVLSMEAWLESPMVYDTRLRGMILTKAREPNGAPRADLPAVLDDPRPGLKEAIDEALNPRPEIARIVRAANPKFRACYEQGLKKNPILEGKVTVQFVIGTDGRVTVASDESDPPFADPAVPACIVREVKKLVFAKSSGGPVSVKFPFVFSAAR